MNNISTEKITESNPTSKFDYFYRSDLIDDTQEAIHRIQCVQAVHSSIRSILEFIHNDDGIYIKGDKGKKIPLKITKFGKLYSRFEEHFNFHFKFILDMNLEYHNKTDIKLKDPRFFIDSLATRLTDNAVIKVRLSYASKVGARYVEFRFSLASPYEADGHYDSETLNKIYPHKSGITVLRKIDEANDIQAQIRDLLQKHDKITTELGQYADVREVPRFR